jgi:hypothetical protein
VSGPPEKEILRIHKREGRPTPAVGERGGPASWERAGEGIAGTAPQPFLYADTAYAKKGSDPISARTAPQSQIPSPPAIKGSDPLLGPMMKGPVWTWEVPVYFWLGGLASGASFVAAGADLAGDEEAAALLRRLALGAAVPCAPLLIADLGRPARFLNMLRIFKPRSPMSMGAWCLVAFSNTAAAAVGADLAGRKREAKLLGGLTAVLGTYLGSYTGALLAATAVPVWAKSRALLGPIFVCTAIGSGASASALLLRDGPTRRAARNVAAAAMATELLVSHANERRLGELRRFTESRRFRAAKLLTFAGLALRPVAGPLFLAAGLLYRFAWIEAGQVSARDDETVASVARSR